MAANRKQAMVPEGAIALDPVGTAPGLVVPAGERVVVVLPGPPRELQPMWPAALETAPVRAVLARATPLHGYTLRMFGVPGVGDRQEPARDRGGGGDARRGRDHHLPAARRDRDRRPLPRRGGGDRRGGARRARRAPPRQTLQRRRRDDRLPGREAARGAPAGAGRVVQRRPAGGADHRRARRLGVHGGQRRLLLERGQGGAARRRPGADRGATARSRRRSPRRWRSGRWSASGPTSRSRSPGSPGPDGGTEEKPVGYVCFNARLADGTAIAREPVIPGGRERHPRTLGAGRDAPAADAARRRRASSLGRIRSRA